MGRRLLWDKLSISITQEEIKTAIADQGWQRLRILMLGKSLPQKYDALCTWLEINAYERKAQVQVANYVNALKRGGQIK